MSVVIVGGNDRMARQYMDVCNKYNCKAKVFTQLPGNFKSHIGNPDLIVLFTSTSSSSALHNILSEYCEK